MSRAATFSGALAATKTSYDTRYITSDVADLWRKLGYTVSGTTSSTPVSNLKDYGDARKCSYGASWELNHDVTSDWHHTIGTKNAYTGNTDDRGLSGSGSQSVCEQVCGSYNGTNGAGGTSVFWTPGDADIIFMQTGIGIDQFYDASGDASVAKMSYDSFRLVLSTLEGGTRTEVTTGGTGGTWNNSSASYEYSGGAGSTLGTGTWRYSTTQGATMSISFTGPAIDIAVGTFNGNSNGLSADQYGRPITVKVDGVEVAGSPFETDLRVFVDNTLHDFGHRGIHLRNLGQGSHTVTLEAGAHAQSGAFIAVDYWTQPVENPPIIVALKEMFLADYAAGVGSTEADYDAVMVAFDDAVDDHRADNPKSRLVIVDLTGDFPHPAYLGSDDLHPTQGGHDWIARVALKAMLAQGPYVLA